VESSGNYETYGYAGFFGIAMDYQSLNDGIIRKACPPIVSSAYTVSEIARTTKKEDLVAYEKKVEISQFVDYFLKRMKNMLPSAFGYVEGSGLFYGLSLIGRTLLPRRLYKASNQKASKMEQVCQPDINKANNDDKLPLGIPLEEKVGIVKSAFALTGWKQFAPLVIFAGHGSHSANNPFGSSLDCGACAASPGRHNARMLAKLANLPEVRKALADSHNVMIPNDTIFIGAEHNTTTDDITLFDLEVPESHRSLVQTLKKNLLKAQRTATHDRLGNNGNSVATAQRKANDWGETRPEWGLAKNAGFIIGPRSLTKNINLDSRCFLHSYDWELDNEGKSLEGIMQGPMVVTQWINNHYYFSTIDNDTYGGGSKITHNVTGKFGVVQGNGGDLKMGLPLQSLFGSDENMYHQPLRLSVSIQAPLTRVSNILSKNENLKMLLDNEWIYLLVIDPKQNNDIFRYRKSLQWESVSMNATSTGILKNKKTKLTSSELAV
ncbi:MAG: putative inorganic carbon transporter subunit DabA, partial [Maribacter sp.]